MVEWVKQHPYITGSLVVGLIVLYIVLRGNQSQQQITSTGPSEALQAANLQAQTQQNLASTAVSAQDSQLNAAIAAKQIDAATSLANIQAQSQVALTNLADTKDVQSQQITAQQDVATQQVNAALQESQFQSIAQQKDAELQAAVAGAQIGAQQALGEQQVQAQVQIAGIQADVSKLAISDQLAALKDTNLTNISLANIGASRDVNLATLQTSLEAHVSDNTTALGELQANDALQLGLAQVSGAVTINQQNVTSADYLGTLQNQTLQHVSDNALSAITNTNWTNLQLGLGADAVQTHTVDVLGGVYNNLINTQGQVALTQSNNQTSMFNNFLSAFSAVDFNRGGSGGANQVQVWSSIFGSNPNVAPGSTSNPFSSIAQGLGTAFKGLFGPGGGVPINIPSGI
jgi:hypothetical protein